MKAPSAKALAASMNRMRGVPRSATHASSWAIVSVFYSLRAAAIWGMMNVRNGVSGPPSTAS